MAMNPQWWTENHTSTWNRVKEAMHRDWEQTKSDLSMRKKGQDLDQNVDDTVKQAAGKDAIPAEGQRNPGDDEWTTMEPAIRYGYAAGIQYRDTDSWDDPFEAKLKDEWESLRMGRDWTDARSGIRSGWESSRNKK